MSESVAVRLNVLLPLFLLRIGFYVIANKIVPQYFQLNSGEDIASNIAANNFRYIYSFTPRGVIVTC